MKLNWKALILSFLAVFATAALGSLFTEIGPWYESVKPSITPPNWAFPIAWTAIFLLLFLSLYLSWVSAKNKKQRNAIFGVYGANLLLNLLWTVFYFKMHNPLLAFFDIILLWISIAWMISVTYNIHKSSAYMLLPYILWVSFAAVLNFLSI